MTDPANPFAPPSSAAVSPLPEVSISASMRSRSWPLSLAIWTLVCVLSAAPSFYWGFGTIAQNQMAAMSLGIAIFIAAYTLADQLTQRQAWRQLRAISLTLKIGYVTRIMISLIFPIGMAIDVFCGLFSVGIVQGLMPFLFASNDQASRYTEQAGFLGTLLVTLVQGIVLNLLLFSYMAVVLGVVVVVRQLWLPPELRTSEL